MCFTYNPSRNLISQHLNTIGRTLDLLSSKYSNIVLIGDFNADVANNSIKEFCELYQLKNLIKGPTCFKNSTNPTAIDLILTNSRNSFCNSCCIETGLSDFHKMTITVLKTHFQKQKPKVKSYRDYKSFSNNDFRDFVLHECDKLHEPASLKSFLDICHTALNKSAPLKQKYVRANNSPFINKEVKKGIMTRTRLHNRFLKNKTHENRIAYKKQRNTCLTLVRKAKQDFYSNLDKKSITDNKTFWKTITPCLTNKSVSSSRISLIEEDIIQDNKEIANVFNEYFTNIVEDLRIPQYNNTFDETNIIEDPLLACFEKFKDHPSILTIQNRIWNRGFSFQPFSKSEIENEILVLDETKSCQEFDIPTKIIKQNHDFFSDILYKEMNKSLELGEFPEMMKIADVIPIYKKGNRFKKENYRPVSLLSNLSKVFERCIYKQLSKFFENFLSNHQCGFRQNFSTQHSLIYLLEKWRKSVDQGNEFGALLTDLSKAFDCLPHDLLAAKLHAYGLEVSAVKILYSYLTNRKQRTKILNGFSSWDKISYGVPQGSILGPFLFNIFICDMFFSIDFEVASYADDTTPYVSGKNINNVIGSLENASSVLFKWFKNNQMKANPDKCHALLSIAETKEIRVDDKVIENSRCEKLLGINIDSKLSFDNHVKKLCDVASAKLKALTRVAPYLDTCKKKLLMNAFFKSQFNYCPLVWMFHSRILNNRINRLHEKCLRLVYNDQLSSYEDLLITDGSTTIHQRNLQSLSIELYKRVNGMSPDLMKDVFPLQPISHYDLRVKKTFFNRKVKSVYFGTETLAYLGPKIWEMIPLNIRSLRSLSLFKAAIRTYIFLECPCRICKIYIPQVGFV